MSAINAHFHVFLFKKTEIPIELAGIHSAPNFIIYSTWSHPPGPLERISLDRHTQRIYVREMVLGGWSCTEACETFAWKDISAVFHLNYTKPFVTSQHSIPAYESRSSALFFDAAKLFIHRLFLEPYSDIGKGTFSREK